MTTETTYNETRGTVSLLERPIFENGKHDIKASYFASWNGVEQIQEGELTAQEYGHILNAELKAIESGKEFNKAQELFGMLV